MNRRQLIGAVIFTMALEGIIAYAIMVYYYPVPVLQLTVFIMVALMLGLTAWIGYTMMTEKPKPEKEEEEGEQGKTRENRGRIVERG
ncbi:MAG: transcriptional regulator [Thermoproteota archaeon]